MEQISDFGRLTVQLYPAARRDTMISPQGFRHIRIKEL